MNANELREVLNQHAAWLRSNEPGGMMANLRWADLREADLRWADLRGADLSGANLSGANLRWANLRGANLRWANLRWANLRGADLRGADLRGADLRGANLRGADLRWANLRWANLRGADLRGANLRWANLSGANLRGANLRGADLREADLRGADLSGANLSGTCLDPALRQMSRHVARCRHKRGLLLYRTATSQHVGSTKYLPGRTYTAPHLSYDGGTDCHPGIYAGPLDVIRDQYPDASLVQVYVPDWAGWQICTKGVRCGKLRVLRYWDDESEGE